MNLAFNQKVLLIISLIVFFYLGLAFMAPMFMKGGYTSIATTIYEIYEKFCHQRVERSLFLMGEKSFYTTQELKMLELIPNESSENQYPEYFGHDYIGNETVGYKVAVCIRDIALYGSFVIFGFLLGLVNPKKLKISGWVILVLLLPILLDVGFQTLVEKLAIEAVPTQYINSISKRIVTGVLGGIGLVLSVLKLFEIRLTNSDEKERMTNA